jgi:predicted RNase H-like nuclease (RuvC/YqgF family)
MAEEEQQPKSNLPEMPKHSGPPRRRGRRGGRGRRRPASITSAPVSDAPIESAEPIEREFSESSEALPPQREKFQRPRRSGSPLMQAADEVAEVIESLKQTLAQMEEVMELIEVAERQKLTDEREIESLRRALRQLQPRRPN